MNPATRAYYILRYLGPRFAIRRAKLGLQKALGVTRRKFHTRTWESISLQDVVRSGTPISAEAFASFKREQSIPFLFPLGSPPVIPLFIRQAQGERQPSLQERLRLLEEDRCVYFLRHPSPRKIDWYVNPFDGLRGNSDAVWCDIPDFLPTQGDPRTLWEPSRAAWALDLARAKPHGQSMDAATFFWRWVDSWMAACPPFRGFQWKCGQESSVRLLALAIGLWSLADDRATTPDRWVQFARLAWATGYRVSQHIGYAISQRNNHALSEACGLLLISHLFPEFRESKRWKAIGRKVFAEGLMQQTYADGTYLQHSMNYHRVMLHASLTAMRLAELSNSPFDREIYDRVSLCGEYLFQMMDETTGRVPNYGNNDGACLLPWNECDFTDFRPVVQATHYLTHRERRLPPGPWDEDLCWLFDSEASSSSQSESRPAVSSAFGSGGYYTLRTPDSWCMVRCHDYSDRPGQYDPLHLDLWWRGLNVLQDCGTWRYYDPTRPELESYFKSGIAHNTIEVDGASPVQWVSRFLFFPWPRCVASSFGKTTEPAGVQWFEGQRHDYARRPWRVVHRRTVLALGSGVWAIIDDLLGRHEHSLTLHWHCTDAPYQIDPSSLSVVFTTSEGRLCVCVAGAPFMPTVLDVVRGSEELAKVQGLAAPYYGERSAVPTIEARFRCALPQRIVTLIGCGVTVSCRMIEHNEQTELWTVDIESRRCHLDLERLAFGSRRVFRGWASS